MAFRDLEFRLRRKHGAYSALPAAVGCLTALTRLVLGGRCMQPLPTTLTQLQQLQTLALTCHSPGDVNSIHPMLPPGLCALSRLQRLDIALYGRPVLPSLLQLTGLTQLRIRGAVFGRCDWEGLLPVDGAAAAGATLCSFTAVPCLAELSIIDSSSVECLGIPECCALTKLELVNIPLGAPHQDPYCRSSSELSEGPYLKRLRVLNLSRNRFQDIPASLAMATSLQELDMSCQFWPFEWRGRCMCLSDGIGWTEAGLSTLALLQTLRTVNLSVREHTVVSPALAAAVRHLETIKPDLAVEQHNLLQFQGL